MIKNTVLKGTCALRAFAIAGALTLPALASADEVALKSADGTVNIVGEFVAFEENAYVVRTGLGELRISAERVRCEGDACPVFETATADIVIAGSDTVGLGMMPLLIQGFGAFQNADTTITSTSKEGEIVAEMIGEQGFGDPMGSYLVSSTASGDAFKKLLSEETQIGMASRRIKPAEARALRDAGAGNMISPAQEHIVAVDSLVVIIHPDNPVQRLTTQQLAGIYSGQIKNWKDVGGNDAPIALFDRQDGSGTRGVFQAALFGGDGLPVAETATEINDNTKMATAVNADPNAIGYVSYAFQRGAKPLPLVNECGIVMTPDAFSARTEEYAFQRRLYLYNRGDSLTEATQEFLDYAQSSEADEVIQKAGFIGLGIDKRPQPLDGSRARALLDPNVDPYEGSVMREMLGMMVDYDRLSSTFRFTTGSSRLDERAMLDMQRLTDYLETKPAGTEVLFVGFTDDVGAFDSNRTLSTRRAEQVMGEIAGYGGERLANVEMSAAGYGEVAPSACNGNEEGRQINRRVEVWVNVPNNS
jgi:phosphate transport system substrate-binding protein